MIRISNSYKRKKLIMPQSKLERIQSSHQKTTTTTTTTTEQEIKRGLFSDKDLFKWKKKRKYGHIDGWLKKRYFH